MTIAAFWLRYLSRHDAAGTVMHVVILVVAITVSLVFRATAYAEMKHRASGPQTRWVLTTGLVAACVTASFSWVVLTTPHFRLYGLSFFPELSGARLSGENLRGVDLSHARVNGAVLDGADLRDAHLEGVPMQRANLKGAKLEAANLDKANLHDADLRDASLQDASLQGAVLKGVHLNKETNIKGARFEGADLKSVTLLNVPLTDAHFDSKTQFDRAGLRGVDASGAKFHTMVFDGLDIRKANFRDAQLEGVIFRNVRAGAKTRFDYAAMRKAKFECVPPTEAEFATRDDELPDNSPIRRFKNSHFDFAKLQDSTFGPCLMSRTIFEGAFLRRSTFKGTILTKSEFRGAMLDDARFLEGAKNLDGAKFDGARLTGADFTGAKNLKAEQLEDACGDARTRLPELLGMRP